MFLLRKGKKSPLNAYDAGNLEGILVGTQRNQGHWQRAGFNNNGNCPWCPEHSPPHRDERCNWNWRCQHPDAIALRQQYFQVVEVDTSNWPSCLAGMGILPILPVVLLAGDTLPPIPDWTDIVDIPLTGWEDELATGTKTN